MPNNNSIQMSLAQIQTIKRAIYDVIRSKGVTIDESTPFSSYPEKINEISGDVPPTPGTVNWDVTLVGSQASYDSNTGIFTGAPGSESYLTVNHDIVEGDDIEFLFKMTPNNVNASSAAFGSSVSVWWAGVFNGTVGGWFNGGATTDLKCVAGKSYWVKIVNSTDFTLYGIEDNNYTKETLPSMPLLLTMERYDWMSKFNIIVGANHSHWNENMHGTVDLSQSYLKINGTTIFG